MKAITIVILKPRKIEMITLEKPPTTVNIALRAHAHVIAPCGCFSNQRMPSGNGMPRKNPRGKIIKAETKIRTEIGMERKAATTEL